MASSLSPPRREKLGLSEVVGGRKGSAAVFCAFRLRPAGTREGSSTLTCQGQDDEASVSNMVESEGFSRRHGVCCCERCSRPTHVSSITPPWSSAPGFAKISNTCGYFVSAVASSTRSMRARRPISLFPALYSCVTLEIWACLMIVSPQ